MGWHHQGNRRHKYNSKDTIGAPSLLASELKLYGFTVIMKKGGRQVSQVKCNRCGRHFNHGTIQGVRDHAATH